MERKERDGLLSRRLKQEMSEMSSCYSNFAKDKENSEPMDVASPLSSATNHEDDHSLNDPQDLIPYSVTDVHTPSVTRYETIQSAHKIGSSVNAVDSMGAPISLSQLPSSAFSFEFPDMQSPNGSGLLTSPIGSVKLGKKRPLSISPLSSSSINIDALVRGSPTSLLSFVAHQSRNSSAGSFGHLSPSLYTTSAVHNHNGFNRPAISLSKAAHPNNMYANNLSQVSTNEVMPPYGRDQMSSELADIADHHVNSQPLMKASSDLESERDLYMQIQPFSGSDYSSNAGTADSLVEETKPYQKHTRRVYYAYPAVEQPHFNKCMWEHCQNQCESLDELVTHVNTEHIYQESRKDFICRWSGCVREGRPFKAQYMLLVHMRRHTGEKPHRCHYEGCDKAYSRLENLKTHLRSHTGEKPYLCKYEGCNKAFSNASDCAKHMNRTHSDEKPYGCLNPGCTKRYTDPSSRRKHMKNCQVNKKAKTLLNEPDMPAMTEDAIVNELEETKKSCSQLSKKTTKTNKKDKKKKDDSRTTEDLPLQNDMGYISSDSQCTPAMLINKSSRITQLSGYNSSGYDTEYPSLPEDHRIPPLISMMHPEQHDQFYSSHEEIIKTEQFSPSSQLGDHVNYQLSQLPPPYTNGSSHSYNKLPMLPEIQYSGNRYYHQQPINSNHSNGYSNYIDSHSDDSASLLSSFNGQLSLKGSDLANSSHSSFSTISSRSSGQREYSKFPLHSYRNLRPPELILRAQHQPYSVQMSDIKSHSMYYRHSDELSIRSSHSSRYSGSEYSEDIPRHGPPPPLPSIDIHPTTPRDPLPLPQSMQGDFMDGGVPITSGSPSHYNNQHQTSSTRGMPSSNTYSTRYAAGGGSIPLQHFELPLGTNMESPNMIIGNMNVNTTQLHQESLLLESLSNPPSSLHLNTVRHC